MPSTFFDRVDQSDGPWGRAARNPAAHVEYMLLSTNTSNDLLSTLYPEAAAGGDRSLEPVYANRRYTLVQVPNGYQFGDDSVRTGVDANGDGVISDDELTLDPDADTSTGTTGSGSSSTDGETEGSPDVQGGYDGIEGEEGSPLTSDADESTDTDSGTSP